MGDFKLKSGEKIVLIGDSITDCGRRDQFPPLGNGYVSIAANLTTAKYPERFIKWVNKGISGDVVQGLASRWSEDVINEKPDWVSIAIGINNVARDYTSGRSLDESVREFEGYYRQILTRTREETTAKLIMFEVFYIPEEDEMKRNFNIEPYNEVIHSLADKFDVLLVPVNSAFREAVSKRPGHFWTRGDGVHPLPVGHTLMALKFLEVLGW